MAIEIEVELDIGATYALTVDNASGVTRLITGRARLMGWSLSESTGAAVAAAKLTSGTEPRGYVDLASGASDNRWFGPKGVVCNAGVAIDVTAGSVNGVVYVAYEC